MNLRATLVIFIVSFIASGCATTLRSTSVPGGPRERAGVMPPVPESSGKKLVRVAAEFLGRPYRYGGDDPRGFDCSGLVFYSYDRVGIKVPRTAADQRKAAERVKRSALEPGDLVFFRSSKGRVDHVGIYAGDGRFIHSPRAGQVVSYADLDDPYYRSRFVGAGRF